MVFSTKSAATVSYRKAGENRRISRRSKCCIRCLSIRQRTVVVYIRFLRIGQSIVCLKSCINLIARLLIMFNGTDSIDETDDVVGSSLIVSSLSISQRAIVGH